MKTIIAGSRTITDVALIERAVLECPWGITWCACGDCPGPDRIGAAAARKLGARVKVFCADWIGLGRAAGPVRNQEMVDWAEALLLIWDGKSRGSADVLRRARKARLLIHEVRCKASCMS